MTDTGTVNVCDHGVAGDGVTMDTSALQSAIDSCAEAGGGMVLVPAGTYLTGTIYLKSNVELHLRAGATLRGSPNPDDYNADDVFPENSAFSFERVSGAHLVIAYCAENVAITGQGTIDGGSSQFFESLPPDGSGAGNFQIKDWRPGQMVFFCRCRQVAVRDVSLLNAPYWTLFLLGCDDVRIRGVRIVNPPQTANGDGIDIDCCANVTVSDCIIRSGDDSITLRGNAKALGRQKPCENVVVSNCVLSSPCNAIRVGVGDGLIRNCSFSNIVITDSRTGINMVCRYSDRVPVGTSIENIHFSQFTMDVILPLQMIEGAGATEPAGMRDVTFSGFHVHAQAGCYVGGNPGLPMQRIRFRDWDLFLSGGAENCALVDAVPYPYPIAGHPGTEGRPALPCAVYGTHLDDVSIHEFRVRWADELSAVWRDGLMFEHVSDLTLSGLNLRQPQPDAGAALRCRDVDGVCLSGSRATAGTTTFLRVEQSPPDARVHCIGNDLTAAGRAWESDVTVCGGSSAG